MNEKVIFHVDMDQFFVAVELRDQPLLRGKPVVVGGSALGRGIVTTASYEARRYGLRSGMSASDAVKLCPQAIFLRSDTSKYLDASRRIMKILLEFTDRVEPASVDEAYMDVSGVVWKEGGPEALAMKIKHRIRERERLIASIGGGPNRIVAKMASGLRKPDGMLIIPAQRVEETFRDLPVGELIGVGRSTQRVLQSFGIRTVGQLAVFPADILHRRFGKWGDELSRLARGDGSATVRIPEERPQEKSMGHEHTFSRNLTDKTQLLGRLHLLSERVARRLRAAHLAGATVCVKLRYKGFETVIHGHKLKHFVQHELDIYPAAEKLFHECYRTGEPVRLIGVQVSDLMHTTQLVQQELFVQADQPDRLCEVCDEIKERFGERFIGSAASLFESPDRLRRASRRAAYLNPFHPHVRA